MTLNFLCLKVKFIVNCILVLSISYGCSKPPRGDRKETVQVTGRVSVDGEVPSSAIKVTCHDKDGLDTSQPSYSWSMTGEDGEFALSTYETGDGVPPGNYALTFMWGKMNAVSMSYGGPDQLKGKYDELSESPVDFEVTADSEPIDLGTIELTTAKK